MLIYSLLGGVVELVFPGAVEALGGACVGPDLLHGREELCRVRLRVLHTGHYVTH